MPSFPAVDPIPLPAPIWLLKLLHIVTLALHFVAVEMLLGGLLLAVLLSLFRNSPASMVTARALARRLTVVMTFVINLAVPPLLFAQVLYGRALYTSSVLIGLYWISIVGLLMLTYWLLYRFTARLEAGKSAWWIGLSAWLLAGSIARLLSTNMTLMLRPEVWRPMYSASAMGAYLPPRDPTLEPRWLLMMAGGLFIGGLWMVYLAGRSTFTAEEKSFLAGLGGKEQYVIGRRTRTGGVPARRGRPSRCPKTSGGCGTTSLRPPGGKVASFYRDHTLVLRLDAAGVSALAGQRLDARRRAAVALPRLRHLDRNDEVETQRQPHSVL